MPLSITVIKCDLTLLRLLVPISQFAYSFHLRLLDLIGVISAKGELGKLCVEAKLDPLDKE